MQTMMWALNGVYEREETRGFVRKRLIAFAMIACAVASFALIFVLLIMGPHMTGWIGSAAGNETAVRWIWWTVQWPVLLIGLMVAFAVILYLAPNVDQPRWKLFSPGALVAIVIWLVASGAFAFYTSRFASYNKAWGSLAAVIIMLTWLWLSALALIVGGSINAESQRRRRQSTGS
jgi:membrane protein